MTNNQIQFFKAREEQRHNIATETENIRHNVESEGIGWGNVGAAYANVGEMARHNVETEGINWYSAKNLGELQSKQANYTFAQTQTEAERRRLFKAQTKQSNSQTYRNYVEGTTSAVRGIFDIVGGFSHLLGPIN